jgi:imidazole glycerol-phosphate synthase subunit HisF
MLPRLMPVLTLIDGQVYRTKQFKNPRYIGDPVNTVKLFNEKMVDELIIFDIGNKKQIRLPHFSSVMQDITSQAFMPMAFGGGVFSVADAKKVFDAGFEKVIINSALFINPNIVEEIASIYGSQSVVVSIDLTKNIWGNPKLCTRVATKIQYENYLSLAQVAEKLGAGELIVRDVQKDGLMQGMNLDIVRQISTAVNIPVVATGGAWDFNHIKDAIASGAHSVAAGNMFVYKGKRQAVLINYPSKNEIKEIFDV